MTPAVLAGPRRLCHREFPAETLVSAKSSIDTDVPTTDEETALASRYRTSPEHRRVDAPAMGGPELG